MGGVGRLLDDMNMADLGRISPSTPTWPTRPTDGVVRRDHADPDQQRPKQPPAKRQEDEDKDDDQQPHLDEYA